MTFSKSVSKRPNLCRNDSYIFGQKHVSVSKWHCVEIVCVEVTGTLYYYLPPIFFGNPFTNCRLFFARSIFKGNQKKFLEKNLACSLHFYLLKIRHQ